MKDVLIYIQNTLKEFFGPMRVDVSFWKNENTNKVICQLVPPISAELLSIDDMFPETSLHIFNRICEKYEIKFYHWNDRLECSLFIIMEDNLPIYHNYKKGIEDITKMLASL